MPRLGMLGNVVQRFLHHPKQRNIDRRRVRQFLIRQADLAGHAGILRELLDLVANGRLEAENIELVGPQTALDAPCGLHDRCQQRAYVHGALLVGRRLRQLLEQLGQVHPECRQGRSHFIMEFTRNCPFFFLSGGFQVADQFADFSGASGDQVFKLGFVRP